MNVKIEPKFPRPVEGDCAPYFFRYISKVPDTDIVTYLEDQQSSFSDFIDGLTPDQLHYRYAPGKWTLAEMIGHVLDTERVFAYRMLCISRGEQKSLPGFEQDDYVAGSIADSLNGNELRDEWNVLRASSVLLCQHMNNEMAARTGKANDASVKAYAYPYMLAGHVLHHLEVAHERYLQPV
jgi:hypothetical protein